MNNKRIFAMCLTAFAAFGCAGGSNDENLSSRAGDDPARVEQAQAEMESTAARAREAEARKVKGGSLVECP